MSDKGGSYKILSTLRRDLVDAEFRGLLLVAGVLLLLGTVFYAVVEEWNILHSFYFSVTTLTTVGYGDFHPTTDISRAFTAIYALTGVGFILALLAAMARLTVTRINDSRPKKQRSSKRNRR